MSAQTQPTVVAVPVEQPAAAPAAEEQGAIQPTPTQVQAIPATAPVQARPRPPPTPLFPKTTPAPSPAKKSNTPLVAAVVAGVTVLAAGLGLALFKQSKAAPSHSTPRSKTSTRPASANRSSSRATTGRPTTRPGTASSTTSSSSRSNTARTPRRTGATSRSSTATTAATAAKSHDAATTSATATAAAPPSTPNPATITCPSTPNPATPPQTTASPKAPATPVHVREQPEAAQQAAPASKTSAPSVAVPAAAAVAAGASPAVAAVKDAVASTVAANGADADGVIDVVHDSAAPQPVQVKQDKVAEEKGQHAAGAADTQPVGDQDATATQAGAATADDEDGLIENADEAAAADADDHDDGEQVEEELLPTDIGVPEDELNGDVMMNEDGTVELADGETVPVVDEDGNQIGILHSNGQVTDESGDVIGGMDEEGNVVLYETDGAAAAAAAGEDDGQQIILSPAEEEAEQLMRQAAVHWNMHNNRPMAEKLQRKALKAVTEGEARPEVVAEVASSLADMLYAQQKFDEAQEAVATALDAAENSKQWALYIKLSNNMGAVLRRLEKHDEGRKLHSKALDVALEHFGADHATATLARGNLVDVLDAVGEVDAARSLLKDSLTAVVDICEKKEQEEATAANGKDTTAVAQKPQLNTGEEEELTGAKKSRAAAIRCYIELGRLEMKAKQFDEAETQLKAGLDMATSVFGAETQQAASILAVLATCYRQAANLPAARELYKRLYNINERQAGNANQSAVMLAKTIAEVAEEQQEYGEAVTWAEKALEAMQAVVGVRVHPYLEPFFTAVVNYKNKAGDTAGAEETKKQFLKGLAQLQRGAQRGAGAAGGAGAGAGNFLFPCGGFDGPNQGNQPVKMVRHNNVIPNGHFKKKWQFRVKTWFNQPARKVRRRNARAEKAAKLFPRPAAGPLRPVVRGQTIRYNSKTKLGRGFTLEELKEAGIPKKLAPTIGISVDHRRRNRSLESLQENVNRLKAYRSNLVIFPRNAKKPKAFEASAEDVSTVTQVKGTLMPITKAKPALEFTKITEDMKSTAGYSKLRVERMNARLVGVRAKKAKEAEAENKE
eukprot:jgi/Chrzof1/5332/Cz15g22130.t1